jgi:hypothetical protein
MSEDPDPREWADDLSDATELAPTELALTLFLDPRGRPRGRFPGTGGGGIKSRSVISEHIEAATDSVPEMSDA